MRSVWSTLVAVTLVVAGVRVSTAATGTAGYSELHAAKLAPTARRAHSPSRPLASFVVVSSIELRSASRQVVATAPATAIDKPRHPHSFVRNARGPPRA